MVRPCGNDVKRKISYKNYEWKPFASRPIGRPKNRWEDDVRKDLQTVKIKNWKNSVLNRDLVKTVSERNKTHMSCSVYQGE
jgi:hypothetical protein